MSNQYFDSGAEKEDKELNAEIFLCVFLCVLPSLRQKNTSQPLIQSQNVEKGCFLSLKHQHEKPGTLLSSPLFTFQNFLHEIRYRFAFAAY